MLLTMPTVLRVTLLVGSVLFLGLLLLLLRRKKLNVQYSIIWLCAAVVLLLFAAFPATVAALGSLFNFEMPVNLVFSLLFIFILLLLLSLSTIVTGFSQRIKHLSQTQALLEERVRQLEAQLKPPPEKHPDANS